MNKTEFLNALEAGLGAASPEERVAAMQYYTEYFDEAGPEKEADVLAELGEPQKLAEEIIAASGAVAAQAQEQAEATAQALNGADTQGEPGGHSEVDQPQAQPENPPPPQPQWQQAAPQAPNPPPPHPPVTGGYTPVHYRYATGGGQPPPYTPQTTAPSSGVTAGKVLFIVLACIFLIPVLSGLFGVLVGVLVALVIVFLIPMILAVAFVAAGIGCIIMGAFIAAGAVGSGIFTIGTGIFLLGLGR